MKNYIIKKLAVMGPGSRGVLIPNPFQELLGIDKKVKMYIDGNKIILEAYKDEDKKQETA